MHTHNKHIYVWTNLPKKTQLGKTSAAAEGLIIM